MPHPDLAHPEDIDRETISGCITGKDSLLVSPIIYWTEKDVWEFLNQVVSVPHCHLYDEGWHRLGCICCPMSSHKQKLKELALYPHVKRNWIRAIMAIRRVGIQRRVYLVEHVSSGFPTGGGNSYRQDIWSDPSTSTGKIPLFAQELQQQGTATEHTLQTRTQTDGRGGQHPTTSTEHTPFQNVLRRSALRRTENLKSLKTSSTGGSLARATSTGMPRSSSMAA